MYLCMYHNNYSALIAVYSYTNRPITKKNQIHITCSHHSVANTYAPNDFCLLSLYVHVSHVCEVSKQYISHKNTDYHKGQTCMS